MIVELEPCLSLHRRPNRVKLTGFYLFPLAGVGAVFHERKHGILRP